MSNLYLPTDLGFDSRKYNIDLSLIEFKEDEVTIIYSPALDVTGYGYNHNEARNSFTEALKEFLVFSKTKKTLNKVLSDLGWSIKEDIDKPKICPPKDSDLVHSNSTYNDIVNHKNYKVSRENIELAF